MNMEKRQYIFTHTKMKFNVRMNIYYINTVLKGKRCK